MLFHGETIAPWGWNKSENGVAVLMIVVMTIIYCVSERMCVCVYVCRLSKFRVQFYGARL